MPAGFRAAAPAPGRVSRPDQHGSGRRGASKRAVAEQFGNSERLIRLRPRLRQFVASSAAVVHIVDNGKIRNGCGFKTALQPDTKNSPNRQPARSRRPSGPDKTKNRPGGNLDGFLIDVCPKRGTNLHARILYLLWAGFASCTQRRFFHEKCRYLCPLFL